MQKMVNKHQKGYVLITTLVIMGVLLTITYFLSDVLFSETSISRNQKSATVAFYLSEAGVQEAIWSIKNDEVVRTKFLTTTDGETIIPAKNLIEGGSYSVSIKNSSLASATITSTGIYNMGSKEAQRKITLNVIQTAPAIPYDYDAALFIDGPNPGNIDLQNLNISSLPGSDPWSIYCGGNIDIGNANLNIPMNIYANGAIETQNSSIITGGTEQENYPGSFTMPGIDVDSTSPSSYKSQAITQNQYYTSAQFDTLLKTQTTFNGIVYIAGSGGITLKNKTVVINGLLVSEGTIGVTNASLTVNHVDGSPSGIITLSNLNITNASVKVAGLVYVGVLSSASTNANLEITGALLAHDFNATNINLRFSFNKDWVNETIEGGGNLGTPVIEFNHWEEEY